MTGRPLSRDDYLDTVEIRQLRKMLLRKCAWKRKTAYDDVLIFEIFVQTGLRRAELCNLKVCDVEPDGDRPTIKVRNGKGSKPRVVDISKPLAKQIGEYLAEHRPEAKPDEPLICNRFGKHIGLGIMSNKIAKWGRMMARRHPENRRWPLLHTHTLRHTFATNALNLGLPLSWVRDMLGHSDLGTTSVYVHAVDRYRNNYAEAMSEEMSEELDLESMT